MEQSAADQSFITLLMPWSMVLRDLDRLRELTGEELGLAAVPELAGQTLIRCGAGCGIALDVRGWLRRLAAALAPGRAPCYTMPAELHGRLLALAQQRIPDAGYWPALQAGYSLGLVDATPDPNRGFHYGRPRSRCVARASGRRRQPSRGLRLPPLVMAGFFTCVHDVPPDNWEYRRFGPQPSTFNVNRAVAVFEPLLESLPHLEWLYQSLADSYSKDLLLQVLCMQVLGAQHVKMPLNTPAFWENYRTVDEKYRILSDTFPKANVARVAQQDTFDINQYRISVDGTPVTVHDDACGVLHIYLLEQYAYRRGDTVIAAGPGDTVVDAGACWGDTSLYFAAKVGAAGQVVAFEFEEANLKILAANLAENPELARQIRVVPQALLEASNYLCETVVNGPSSQCISAGPGTGREVQTVSLDDYVSAQQIPRVDFIKMDIEGAELAALHGAQMTIAKHKPRLAISVYHRPQHIWEIPFAVKQIEPSYRLYLDHFTLYDQETILFAEPPPDGP